LFYPRSTSFYSHPAANDFLQEAGQDRIHLRVHIFPEAKASVLIFHGNGELVMHYDRIASQYRAMGLQLAAIDYRSYGMSTGKPTLQNSMTDAVIPSRNFSRKRATNRNLSSGDRSVALLHPMLNRAELPVS
jgi:alpha-beta hydrolase superfamily lysophospholipase